MEVEICSNTEEISQNLLWNYISESRNIFKNIGKFQNKEYGTMQQGHTFAIGGKTIEVSSILRIEPPFKVDSKYLPF